MNQEILSLRTNSYELKSILMEGRLVRYGQSFTALPREVVQGPDKIESVIFEVIRPEQMIRPKRWKRVLRAIRLENLTIPFALWMSLFAYGFHKGWNVSFGVGLAALLGIIFFEISVHVFNDVEDYVRLIDLPDSLNRNGVLQNGWMSARQLRRMGILCLFLGILFGMPAVVKSPEILIGLGGVGVFGVLSYSNMPFGVKYRALGDLFIFGLQGPLLALGFSQAIFHSFDRGVLWLGFTFGFLAWGTSLAKQIQSFEVDRQRSVRTLAIWLGYKKIRHWVTFIYSSAVACLIAGIWDRSFPLFLLATCGVIAWNVYGWINQIYRSSGPVSALLGTISSRALKIHLTSGLLICLTFLMSRLWVVN